MVFRIRFYMYDFSIDCAMVLPCYHTRMNLRENRYLPSHCGSLPVAVVGSSLKDTGNSFLLQIISG